MDLMNMVVTAITQESDSVKSFEFKSPDAADLPAFTAGAHVEVQMAPHLARSYSLANDPAERDRYVIAVHRAAAGPGGSSTRAKSCTARCDICRTRTSRPPGSRCRAPRGRSSTSRREFPSA